MSLHKIRKNNNREDLVNMAIILLCAGIEERAKGQGSVCLQSVGNTILIDYQIDTLKKVFPGAKIIPVLGFESEKIQKRMHNKIGYIENQVYEETNSVESLRLALNSTTCENVLTIHGNTVFSQQTFSGISLESPFIIYDSDNRLSEKKVGVIVENDILQNMYYGLDNKWCNIIYTTKRQTTDLKKITKNQKLSGKVMYEIINLLINSHKISAIRNKSPIVEFNNIREQKGEVNTIIKN